MKITEMIRYGIVTGIRDKAPILRLLKEEELNLDKTLNIYRSNEAATKQLDSMKQDQTPTDEQVNAAGNEQTNNYNAKKRKVQRT